MFWNLCLSDNIKLTEYEKVIFDNRSLAGINGNVRSES